VAKSVSTRNTKSNNSPHVGRGKNDLAALGTARAEINPSPDLDHDDLRTLQQHVQRGSIVETTLQHKLVHVVSHTLGDGKTPRGLAAGIALYVAGEGKLIQQNAERHEKSGPGSKVK
jgi:hypothetical protein